MIKQIASLAVTGRCFSTERVLNFFPKADVRLSLVYGANGSGKSTISRAFQVLLGLLSRSSLRSWSF